MKLFARRSLRCERQPFGDDRESTLKRAGAERIKLIPSFILPLKYSADAPPVWARNLNIGIVEFFIMDSALISVNSKSATPIVGVILVSSTFILTTNRLQKNSSSSL
ncbi:hypothetical protein PSH90_08595 [Pseudomonas sp. FP1762]|jgi:hypothetical protein|uniref:hypothetical protein n=1 Tax=Pseudomonas TaxID=286 RepID=UPI001F1261A9|nr:MULTISPECIES: hypothetical protein [Pseudomonas]WLG65242.1 hypothetical protein PSH90_08595 [Pseudomonas sp. FP1762]